MARRTTGVQNLRAPGHTRLNLAVSQDLNKLLQSGSLCATCGVGAACLLRSGHTQGRNVRRVAGLAPAVLAVLGDAAKAIVAVRLAEIVGPEPWAVPVAAYHAEVEMPIVRLLVCDDARQFNWLTEEIGLCWIHEGRHSKSGSLLRLQTQASQLDLFPPPSRAGIRASGGVVNKGAVVLRWD